jgi:hypothetical protein
MNDARPAEISASAPIHAVETKDVDVDRGALDDGVVSHSSAATLYGMGRLIHSGMSLVFPGPGGYRLAQKSR